MKEHIGPDDIVATVILMRDVDSAPIILAEGEPDCAVLDGHIAAGAATTVPCFGKKNALGAIEALGKAGVDLVVAVVDADWVGLGKEQAIAGVIYTENYDLDTDIVLLPGLLRRFAIAHFGLEGVAKLSTDGDTAHFAADAVGFAAPFGALRFVSERDDLRLPLRNIPPEAAFDLTTLRCDVRRMVDIAIRKAGDDPAGVDHIVASIDLQLSVIVGHEARFACGHDVCAIIALIGRRIFGVRGLSRDAVERSIRAAVGCAEFKQLRVVEELTSWATSRGQSIWDHPAA